MAQAQAQEGPKDVSFEGLSQELRDNIYSHLFISPHSIKLGSKPDENEYDSHCALRDYEALSTVSRSIHSQVAALFWTQNCFAVWPHKVQIQSVYRYRGLNGELVRVVAFPAEMSGPPTKRRLLSHIYLRRIRHLAIGVGIFSFSKNCTRRCRDYDVWVMLEKQGSEGVFKARLDVTANRSWLKWGEHRQFKADVACQNIRDQCQKTFQKVEEGMVGKKTLDKVMMWDVLEHCAEMQRQAFCHDES